MTTDQPSRSPDGYALAVSSEMLFVDLPHLDRVRRIHELGFAVEIWDWTAKDIDVLTLVEAVDSPHLKMVLDLYHAQIGGGNLIELVRRAGRHIGEIQVADVPGRCEPGTGEINYPALARTLAEISYTGTVGLEGWASGDSELALERFREAFSPK